MSRTSFLVENLPQPPSMLERRSTCESSTSCHPRSTRCYSRYSGCSSGFFTSSNFANASDCSASEDDCDSTPVRRGRSPIRRRRRIPTPPLGYYNTSESERDSLPIHTPPPYRATFDGEIESKNYRGLHHDEKELEFENQLAVLHTPSDFTSRFSPLPTCCAEARCAFDAISPFHQRSGDEWFDEDAMDMSNRSSSESEWTPMYDFPRLSSRHYQAQTSGPVSLVHGDRQIKLRKLRERFYAREGNRPTADCGIDRDDYATRVDDYLLERDVLRKDFYGPCGYRSPENAVQEEYVNRVDRMCWNQRHSEKVAL
ncbi:hypothetical protein CC1G_10054 [Coprinopsis cinerea okayama7|uniref:Uncharacterized protein n=1 Tax=Coprinopsis cinerea (strain Okayama-7 / 130 / ATCC MYA-4618 / FGSC 9003) TaxID=240176 RepID=A8NUY0_COPC7|nr:hypothetical protein CC1G_10054 [Coprinopsis cinerea okayama7\|eukprot:XP_001836560.2 hypothetical protein CC1G_10054 [Coprinopsis cinerea okayama7\